jgi:murein DD-endopeptidase MepM/ murein hydrolase activator NlpD
MSYKSIKDTISKKVSKENLKNFFQKQGLYVLIFLCVVAAGITAIVAWPKGNNEQISDKDEGAAVIEAPLLSDEIARVSPTPGITVSPTPSASPAVSPTGQNGSGKMTLTRPVKGQIINKFSGDSAVPFPALGMWMTHNGVDIKADEGTPVVAALSGTVTEMWTDESCGGTVVITHSGNSKTVYSGLKNITVKKDDKVNAGQKIGEVGEMPKEMDLSFHLHFEYIVDPVYKNGILAGGWQDPEKYFK